MLHTLAEMRQKLKRRVPGLSEEAANDTINEAYSNLARMYPWQEMMVESKFATQKYVATGGAGFANGATDITAATSVSAAWVDGESNGFAGMFIKKDDEAAYYTITSSTSVEITITENYLGKTTTAAASSGDSYAVFKHVYEIASAIETVDYLMHDSYLHEMEPHEFERADPDLDMEGEPSSWMKAGVNTAGNTLVQLYPPRVDDIYEIRVRGRRRVETLADSEKPLIDSMLILALSEADALRKKSLLDPGSVSTDVLKYAVANFTLLYENAVAFDFNNRSHSRYVRDRFFYHGRGHAWYVDHDPYDA
jgi:hypothetical protein